RRSNMCQASRRVEVVVDLWMSRVGGSPTQAIFRVPPNLGALSPAATGWVRRPARSSATNPTKARRGGERGAGGGGRGGAWAGSGVRGHGLLLSLQSHRTAYRAKAGARMVRGINGMPPDGRCWLAAGPARSRNRWAWQTDSVGESGSRRVDSGG